MKKTLLLLFLLASISLQGQEYLKWIERQSDFEKIQNMAEDHFKNKDLGRGSGYRQFKRWEYLVQDRLGPDGQVINYNRMVWDVAMEMKAKGGNTQADNTEGCQASWSLLAPLDEYVNGQEGYNPGLGRVNVVAFHPFDPDIVYIGTPAGGLWKAVNQGGTWVPLTDHLPSIGVSGIVVHPQNPNLIYILTGDGDGADTYCIGVLRSLDGGLNWEETGLAFAVDQTRRGYKLVMSPDNPNVLMAATNSGIYRTADAGATWTQEVFGSFVDIEFKPGDPSTVYAHTSNGFYRSTDNGQSWNTITAGLPTGENRVAIGVSPANPQYVYLFAGPASGDGFFEGLYRSTNSGISFSLQADAPNVLGYSIEGQDDRSQSAYDLAIAVDPDDAEIVITGGINVWWSFDGGVSLFITSHWYYPELVFNGLQYTHADIHELVYNPLDGSLWCGSDGGVFRSPDDGITWEDRSSLGATGLSIMQFYRIAGIQGDPNVLIGGTQDNGSNRWDGGDDITHFDGADGMDCMLHPLDPQIQYHTRQNGSLRKSLDGGADHFGIKPGFTSGYWVTPLAMDPIDPEVIYAGYRDTVYRSANGGEDWTAFVPELEVGLYRSLHIAPANTARIYAATDLRIFMSDDTGASWSEISAGLPAAAESRITMIATDADDDQQVWVTMAGFVNGRKVFYSPNAGSSWQNVSGSLPNLPVNCIIYDASEPGGDNSVYIGTDVGVWFRDSSLNDWIPYMTELPNVPVFDMEIHAASGMLRAGTFGRGIWESPLYDPDLTAPTVACPPNQTASPGAGCVLVLPDFGNLALTTDNCDPDPDILQTPAPGAQISQDTTITLIAQDWEGNASGPCTFQLSLADTQGPVMDCPESVLANTCDGIGQYDVIWVDNCTAAEGALSEGLESGSVFPIGTTLVTWNSIDDNGNGTSCSFEVIRADSMELFVDAVIDETNSLANGSIDITMSGGVPPLQFSWKADGELISTEEDPEGLAAGLYTLEVTDATGCVLVFEPVLVDNITAVSEISIGKEIRIFPNPADDFLWVEWEGNFKEKTRIELADGKGRIQYSRAQEKSKHKIPVRSLAPGVYSLRISGHGWQVAEKVVIVR
ncbi:MAG: HYR domain-containing protein [Saprospirales bacterium]|nr:HYR domain-containing protein [Saprospirales bacterium]